MVDGIGAVAEVAVEVVGVAIDWLTDGGPTRDKDQPARRRPVAARDEDVD